MDNLEIIRSNENNDNINHSHFNLSESQLRLNDPNINSRTYPTINDNDQDDNNSEQLIVTHIIDNILPETLNEMNNNLENNTNISNNNIIHSNVLNMGQFIYNDEEEEENEDNNNNISNSSQLETSTVNSAEIDILSSDFLSNSNSLNNNLQNNNKNNHNTNITNLLSTKNPDNNHNSNNNVNNNATNNNQINNINSNENINNNNGINNFTKGTKLIFNESISSLSSLNKSMTISPFNKLEEYKKSNKYIYLENTCYFANKLEMVKSEGKFDFVSDEGNEICKDLLEQIENLLYCHHIKIASREYRKKFSRAYIYLYEENSLGYLTEILDSAQEATPYLIVNDEKYIFSKDVISKGNQLFLSFCSLIVVITESLNKLYDEIILEESEIVKIELKIKKSLSEFDKYWALYEEKYITELMCIEKISRRYIFDGINIDKQMTNYEKKALIKGKNLFIINSVDDKEYNLIREKFIKTINILNKVANINGKGRNDLEINILYQAEKVLCTVSEVQGSGLRKLAKDVKNSLDDLRNLFQSYSQNIDGVDPQLINNPELVSNLYNWEQTWEKGKKYLCNNLNYKKLLNFNKIIDVIVEKYKEQDFRSLLEQSDPEIFITIPGVLILDAVDRHNTDIIDEFIPNIKNNDLFTKVKKQIKFVYKALKDKNLSYNLFEQIILFHNFECNHFYKQSLDKLKSILSEQEIKEFIRDMNILSMNLQRYKPKDWNEFFQLAMNIEKD